MKVGQVRVVDNERIPPVLAVPTVSNFEVEFGRGKGIKVIVVDAGTAPAVPVSETPGPAVEFDIGNGAKVVEVDDGMTLPMPVPVPVTTGAEVVFERGKGGIEEDESVLEITVPVSLIVSKSTTLESALGKGSSKGIVSSKPVGRAEDSEWLCE